jgi:hypothetical protein
VLYGSITVRLTVDGDRGAAQSRAFTVLKDPRIASTQPDLESRVAFSTTVRDRIATAIAATKRLRSFKAQTASRAKLDSLNAIERTLVTPNVGDPSWRTGGLIARIFRAMGDPDYAPTRSERAAFAETSGSWMGCSQRSPGWWGRESCRIEGSGGARSTPSRSGTPSTGNSADRVHGTRCNSLDEVAKWAAKGQVRATGPDEHETAATHANPAPTNGDWPLRT